MRPWRSRSRARSTRSGASAGRARAAWRRAAGPRAAAPAGPRRRRARPCRRPRRSRRADARCGEPLPPSVVSPDAPPARRADTRRMTPELSIPVIWLENGGLPVAGRLDVHFDRLHLDGGSRAARATREVAFADIASAHIGRAGGERINGRPAMVIGLAAGGSISLIGFDRPGALAELL